MAPPCCVPTLGEEEEEEGGRYMEFLFLQEHQGVVQVVEYLPGKHRALKPKQNTNSDNYIYTHTHTREDKFYQGRTIRTSSKPSAVLKASAPNHHLRSQDVNMHIEGSQTSSPPQLPTALTGMQ
jgi:hypothetical protein